MSKQGFAVGLARAMFWEYVKTGSRLGTATGTQASLTAGTVSGAYVAGYVKTANIVIAPTADVQIQGGDRIVAVPSFGNPRLAPFDIVSSATDSTLSDEITGNVTNEVNSYFTKMGYNPWRSSPRQMGFALQQRFETTDGYSYFLTRIVPKSTVTMKPGGMAFRGEADTVIHVAPIAGTVSYTGQVYGSSGLAFGWQEDTGDYYDLISPDPIHIATYASDGTATTFVLPYTPLSTIITLNATPNEMVKNGTATALSSVVLATKTVTLAAAGTSGDLHVVTYTTNFVP